MDIMKIPSDNQGCLLQGGIDPSEIIRIIQVSPEGNVIIDPKIYTLLQQILRNQLYIITSDYAFRVQDEELIKQSLTSFESAIKATMPLLPDFNKPHKGENIMETENKVTEECVEASIAEEYYTTLGTKTTVCLLTLKNGFEVVGTSACVDPANYSEEIGKPYARKKAFDEAWKVLAYAKQSECCNKTTPCMETPTD